MKKTERKFVITLILVISLNLLFVAAVYFLFDTTDSKKEEVRKIKVQLSLHEKRIENAENLKKELAAAEEAYSKVKETFLDKNSLVNYIEELEYLAEKTGLVLEIKTVSVPAKAPNKPEEKPQFSFGLEGPFGGIYHFLFLLENSRYQIGLEKVRLQKPEKSENWEANFELKLLNFVYGEL